MKPLAVLGASALLSAILATPVPCAEAPETIAVGRIVFVSVPESRFFKLHVPRQYLVVTIDRILAGPTVGDRVLLGVSLDRSAQYLVNDDHGEPTLDGTRWKPGTRVVVRMAPSGAPDDPVYCRPFGHSTEPIDIRNPNWQDTGNWADRDLQALRPIRLFCGSLEDVFIIAEDGPAKKRAVP